MPPVRGLWLGGDFWLRLNTTSAQCLRLSECFFSLCFVICLLCAPNRHPSFFRGRLFFSRRINDNNDPIRDSFDWHYNHCRWMLQKYWPWRSYLVAWTTVTRFCTASPTTLSKSADSLECCRQADHTDRSARTHHIRSAEITSIVSSWSWLRWRTRHFTTLHRRICQTTVSWCRTTIVVSAHQLHCRMSTTDQDSTGWQAVWCPRVWNKFQITRIWHTGCQMFQATAKKHIFDQE